MRRLGQRKLGSSEISRAINRDIVLELIRTHQPIARVDLSRKSGLQPSTISLIVEELLSEKWIVEGTAVARPRGRKPTLLSLNGNLLIFSIDVRPSQATVAVMDLHGHLLMQEHIPVFDDPKKGIALLVDTIKTLRRHFPGKCFEGIGISLPGRVDPAMRQLMMAPNLKWLKFDIGGVIELECGLQVEMENEANVCLIEEIWSGRLKKYSNAVLVSMSEGIGAAILVNGQIVYGKSGMAGEFGHISLDPSGPLCGCGRKGCWEAFASTRAILRYHSESTQPRTVLSWGEFLNLAREGDKSALATLRHQAMYFAKGLQIVVTALAPEIVVLAGDAALAWSEFPSLVHEELAKYMLAGDAPELLFLNRSEHARLRGAAAMLLQRHANYHRSSYLPINRQKKVTTPQKGLKRSPRGKTL
jgi:predicted NBD/HSP70 family sugar kinase